MLFSATYSTILPPALPNQHFLLFCWESTKMLAFHIFVQTADNIIFVPYINILCMQRCFNKIVRTLHKYIEHAAMFSQNCMFTAQFRKLQIFCNVWTYLLRKHKNQYLLLAAYNICLERKNIKFLTQPLHVFWRKHSAFHIIFYVCSIILYPAKAQSILVPSRNLYNIVSQDAT